ncbi:hypothetical protein Hanom_Chr09g00863591 [Helianthus anomalus]
MLDKAVYPFISRNYEQKGKKSESEFHSVRNLLRESWELASILNFLQVPEEMSYDLLI